LNQAKLLEQGSPLDAKDVLLVSNNLIEALKSHGLVIDGVPGDRVRFDPSCHQLLDENEQIQEDQFVTVRFPATIYQGKILRKAGVEKVDQ
jgi:molecular chaperone GrpE (heat shock protein)